MQSPENALKHYQQALLRNPKDLDAQIMCGNLCVELGKFEQAAGYFRRIVRLVKSDDAPRALCYALEQLGNAAQNAGSYIQAEACFAEAIEYQPGNAIHWYNLGNAQRDLGKPEKALHSFTQSLKFDANDADAHNNLGNIQRELGALDKAILSYEKALQLNPSLHHALAHLVHQKQHICDWNDLNGQITQLRNLVKIEPSAQISPFAFLAMPGTTSQEQKQCASNYANNTLKAWPATLMDIGSQGIKNRNSKLKVGYFSADFRLHPLAFLITELIEKHDRNQFEIFAYSYGKNDKTPTRKRFEKAFDHFIDITNLNDVEAAKKIRNDEIDILIDLTGYTQSSRSGIVALKPARIHINWLGFPGTMGELSGEPLFDYLLADEIVAPNAEDFSEKLLYLPCYQPNDSKRPINNKPATCMDVGLQGASDNKVFVFCCFNQTFKITTEVFAVWMRILKQTPNSVLWLLECNIWAKANLQAAAKRAGVNKNRLIFAPRVPIAEHLARHVHADLFLDTLPYNAHTTASDALFMRLPLLTCMGETFASRVAASLLKSVNMPELITRNLAEYEQKALELAGNPEKFAQLKQKLNTETEKSNLFNPTQFVRDLEGIFLDVVNKHNSM